jgi:hypothetical protein
MERETVNRKAEEGKQPNENGGVRRITKTKRRGKAGKAQDGQGGIGIDGREWGGQNRKLRKSDNNQRSVKKN